MTGPLRVVDIVIIAVYFGAVIWLGLRLRGEQRDSTDYFLGHRDLPWWAICLSIVATETSAITVISMPGIGGRGDLRFLQIAAGYLVGRIAIAWWLLPGYFHGTQETAYERLGSRFGAGTRRVASAVFLSTRTLADGVRVFATAIPLAIVTGWSIPISILAVAAATLVYTFGGGIRSVVWVDVGQLGMYVLGGLAAGLAAISLAGGLEPLVARAAEAGKFRLTDATLDWKTPYTLVSGIVGGAFLSAASHGTDQLMVQRLLATRTLRDARRALIGSGVLVILQFALFLLVGVAIWGALGVQPELRSDDIFPRFVVTQLPAGIAGLVVAGILAAAMSTVSSSVNSLASATAFDLYGPLTGRTDPTHLLKAGRWATVGWAIVLVAVANLFNLTARDAPVVVLALSVASLTYGPLLGSYLLAAWPRARGVDVVVAMAITLATMTVVFLASDLAWPWYVPVGTLVTVAVGAASSAVGGKRERVSLPNHVGA